MQVKNDMKKLNIINKIIFLINSISLLALLLSYISQYLNPNIFWPISFFGLLFPILFIINFLFLIYWFSQLKKQLWANIIILLIGIQYIDRYIGVRPNQNKLENNIKFMTYNVRLFNAYKWLPNIEKKEIYKFINNEKADILCIQEIHIHNDTLPDINYDYVHINMKANQSQSKLAIYSNYPQINKSSINIKENNINNNCIYSDIVINNDTIRVYNIHLASNWFNNKDYSFINRSSQSSIKEGVLGIIHKMKKSYKLRGKQVNYIKKHMEKSPYPIIICGDFNDTPVSYAYYKIKGNLIDSFTRSGVGIGKTHTKIPGSRIDYIMHDKIFSSSNYEKKEKILSDHYAIICDININKY